MGFSLTYGITLLVGFALALILTPVSRALAISSGFIDHPKEDRVHRRPTPYLGGLAVAVSAGLAFVILSPRVPLLEEFWALGLLPRTSVPVLLILGAAALALGLIDDRFELSPGQKLVGQGLIASLFLLHAIPMKLSVDLLSWPLGLLWMIGLINAFNLLDNMDGILGGIGTLIGLFLGVLALQMGRPDLGVLALAAGGASLGFLCFNFPPASIFLGDAGAFFIGMLMAGIGWELGGAEFITFGSTAAAITLVLAYPIFDIAFVTVTRFLDRRPVHRGGVDHTTHRLHVFLRGPRSLLVVYGLTALSGGVGIFALQAPPPVAWALVAVMSCLYITLGVMLARVPVRSRRVLTLLSGRPMRRREVA